MTLLDAIPDIPADLPGSGGNPVSPWLLVVIAVLIVAAVAAVIVLVRAKRK